LAAIALLQLGAAAAARAGEPCATPAAGGDWPVASAASAGFDAPALCAVLEGVAGGSANVHALLVVRGGKLVAELYRAGSDQPIDENYGLGNPFAGPVAFDATRLHDIRSISKNVVGLLVGISAARGEIADLDAPALGAFPALADLRSDGRETITIRHLLTMSSGLAWHEWGANPFTSDETRLFWKADAVRWAFDRPLVHAPGSTFNYDGGATTTLGEILVRATGKPLPELARERLFEPLGIREFVWAVDVRDRPLAFAGLRLRPRDLAKLGRLVLDGGRAGEREVVPAAWIDESLRTQISVGEAFGANPPPFAPRGYGYQWWTGAIPWRDRELPFAAGIGNGGQRLFVVPALDLIVVTTAGDYGQIEIGRVVGGAFAGVVAAVAE
jgi:CubicO group peptidase (beta-lactamase class C family)